MGLCRCGFGWRVHGSLPDLGFCAGTAVGRCSGNRRLCIGGGHPSGDGAALGPIPGPIGEAGTAAVKRAPTVEPAACSLPSFILNVRIVGVGATHDRPRRISPAEFPGEGASSGSR